MEGLAEGFGFMAARITEHRPTPLPSRGGASPFLRRCQSAPPDCSGDRPAPALRRCSDRMHISYRVSARENTSAGDCRSLDASNSGAMYLNRTGEKERMRRVIYILKLKS